MVVGGNQIVRCAITNLGALPSAARPDAAAIRMLQLRDNLRRWSAQGLRFVQLREKTLDAGEVFQLAEQAMGHLRALDEEHRPRLLINGRPDIAAAARADGVHLTGHPGELTPGQARHIFAAAGLPSCFVSVSCHSVADAAAARGRGADLLLFGPVFEKRVGNVVIAHGSGLGSLREVCAQAQPVPVLALGGVAPATIPACIEAGAAGIAGIRLFLD